MTIQRRDDIRKKLAELDADALIVYKQVNVRYLTGFSGSNGQLLVGADDVFFTDGRYEEQSARECPDLARIVYGGGTGLMPLLKPELDKRGIKRLGVEATFMTLAQARVLRDKTGVDLVETAGLVESLRSVKTQDEIESVRRACALGDAGFDALLGRLREGMTEIEVAAELEDAMRRAGSDGISFSSIVAFGESAAEPHHAPGERTLKIGDLVKVDFGATHAGYHSDMTRTVGFGQLDDEAKRIYKIVYDAQRAGVDRVAAGISCKDVDAASRSIVMDAGYDFGHGTGHGIGLEVHEAPSVRAESVDILAAGMVVTVEPGIYLPGFGGVRIEDTVAVTESGCDVLTTSPRELIEV